MTEQNNQELVWISETAAVRVRLSEFPAGSGQHGIDVRKFIQSEKYSGPTKKGIWIPTKNKSDIPIFYPVLQAMIKVWADYKGAGYTTVCQTLEKAFVREVTLDESQEKGS